MDAAQCRKKAAERRAQVEHVYTMLRDDYLWAAQMWDDLAAELERLDPSGKPEPWGPVVIGKDGQG